MHSTNTHVINKKAFAHAAKRNPRSHKGDNGTVLVIGGSDTYTGAPILAATAALRAGADKVILAAPRSVAIAANTYTPDLITIKLPGNKLSTTHLPLLKKAAQEADIVLIGNGAGSNTMSVIKAFLAWRKKQLVIDADAIQATNLATVHNTILTPHTKEFNKLLAANRTTKEQLASKLGTNTILLKGHHDLIITAKQTWKNTSGTAAMTVAGTGDVLAGVCAGLYAQIKENTLSARIAAYATGKAGEQLEKHVGNGLLASDLLLAIPKTLRKLCIWT
ncbi:NAD(P)H-hydrate dehydratase [Candidatus Woesearchaeota archaeon]|nr:MAG: NAD(P)H-hydrate dehydratase [Candidatus Woesearchaeota archaeon]